MLKLFKIVTRHGLLEKSQSKVFSWRTFLSQAYQCDEVWDRRLQQPVLKNINLDELFYELDQSFQKKKSLSPVRFDLFANKVEDASYSDELIDLSHKLRMTVQTGKMLDSTPHAIIRALVKWGKNQELLEILDDRLNYGIFLDYYTANLLLDKFWKSKNFAFGAHVASFFMLQEEFDHPLTCALSLLHCYNYLLKPEGWLEHKPPEEPEEEVKIRVKYLRNPFDDEHFDLRDPQRIVGKALVAICKNKNDSLHQSFYILGQALYGKIDKLKEFVQKVDNPIIKDIIELIPEENEAKTIVQNLKTISENTGEHLENLVKKQYEESAEQDIAEQCKVFDKWEEQRLQAIEAENQQIEKERRLADIKRLQKEIKLKEQKLWFFEREEQIDIQLEEKEKHMPKPKESQKKKSSKLKFDEDYVPPELFNAQYNHKY